MFAISGRFRRSSTGSAPRRLSAAALLAVCAAFLCSLAAAASASALNVSGTWNADYHCEHGWCAGEEFPAPGVVLVQPQGSNEVYNGEGELIGTLNGLELAYHSAPGGYEFSELRIFSADGKSWTGPLSDSNGTSGTDTGVLVGELPAEGVKVREGLEAKEKQAKENLETKEKESKEKSKRASATTVSCYVPLLTAYAAWECTATVADASGSQPQGTPTGTVGFSVNSGFSGGFVGGHECALKPSQSGPTAYCTVLFVPAQEVPVGAPAPLTASYLGSAVFRASASSAQSAAVHEEPAGTTNTQACAGQSASVRNVASSLAVAHSACVTQTCPTGQAARARVLELSSPFAIGRTAAAAPARIILVGNPKRVRKLRALSRKAANARAVALLKPSRASLETGVRLYGLAAPLAAGSVVTEATLGLSKEIVLPVKLRERAWIYWEDLNPQARLEHASVVLLISARGGRLLARAPFATYPEVNGKPPVFITRRPGHLLVYGRNPGLRHPRHLTKAEEAALLLAAKEGAAAVRAGRPAHKADTAHSALITIVDRTSTKVGDTFDNEEAAITSTFAKHGIATQATTDAAALSGAVEDAAASGKTNVTIFLDGHGAPASVTTLPTVSLGGLSELENGVLTSSKGTVTSADLTAIVQAHPDIQFNFIIDSCFSGRFVDPLKREGNVGVVMTSASSGESSVGPQMIVTDSSSTETGGRGLKITPAPSEPGLVPPAKPTLTSPNGEPLSVVFSDSETGISPFTAGVVAAFNQAYIGKSPETNLTEILADTRTLEPTYDLAATAGKTKPSPEPTATEPGGGCVGPEPAETASGGWFTGPE